MSGINKVILIGNLGADPEIRQMPSGEQVATISIATSERWKDKQTGEQNEKTEWHRVVFFNRLAEIAGQYLRKGSKVYVEGRIQTRKWQGQDGQDRYTTEIIVRNMQMLDGEAQSAAPQAHAQQQAGQYEAAKQGEPPKQQNDFDDDIPF